MKLFDYLKHYKTRDRTSHDFNLDVLTEELKQLQQLQLIKNWWYTPSHPLVGRVKIEIAYENYIQIFEIELP